ncbi:MAG: hypothetical protein JW900_06520, partial [Anaerolineae bacterium]|nr:hypothetical protein [Anaerolineae bacterium]
MSLSHLRTVELEQVVELVKQHYRLMLQLSRRPESEKKRLWGVRQERIRRLHRHFKPSARPWAAREATQILAEMQEEVVHLAGLADSHQHTRRLEETLESLRAELARARQDANRWRAQVGEMEAELARRPKSTTVTIPEQTIVVKSPLQEEIIRLIAEEGLGRSWRIYQRIIAPGLAASKDSARKVMVKLIKRGLVADYEQDGKAVRWGHKPHGSSRLLTLSETGREWYRQVYGKEPVESEIAVAARQHSSVAHGVGVLEARDDLRAAGYLVDDQPEAILVRLGEQWGRRSQPDLSIVYEGVTWPVEVQRRVTAGVIEKWAKALRLCGRLAIVLFNEHQRGRQEQL